MLHPLDRLGGMRKIDQRLQRLARKNDNVVDRAELLNIELTDKQIGFYVGRLQWQVPHPGVYVLGAAKLTPAQRIRAAVKAASSPALASTDETLRRAARKAMAADEAAGFLWNLDEVPAPDTIALVVGPTLQPAPTGTRIHRTARVQVRQFRHGIPVTTIEETLLALAASKMTTAKLEAAVESALRQKHTNEFQLWKFIAQNSRQGVRGIARLRHVMESRPDGKPAKSILESYAMRLMRRAGVPMPTRNFDIADLDGWRAELDMAWIETMKAIEVDGKAFHATATQSRKDRERQARAEALGWEFIRLTWDDVINHPEQTIARIRSFLFGSVAA